MDARELTLHLDAIAEISGKKDKEVALKKLLEDGFACSVLNRMYDGRITHGINKKTIGALTGSGEESWGNSTKVVWNIMYLLEQRKLTGNQAATTIHGLAKKMDGPSFELFKRILLKDARAGFTQGSLNRVEPGFVFTFDVMLAKKYEEKRVKDFSKVVVEPKLDGTRALLLLNARGAKFHTRVGNVIAPAQWLADIVAKHRVEAGLEMGEWVLDGELVHVSGSFNETQTELRRKDGDASVIFNMFDLVPMEVFTGKDAGLSYLNRRKTLIQVKTDLMRAWKGAKTSSPIDAFQVVPSYKVRNNDDVTSMFERVRDRGLEGLIVKTIGHKYQTKRSADWMKIKAEESEDLRITGFFEGDGKYTGMLGGVIVDRDGVAVRVGGGFSDHDRQAIWQAQDFYHGRMIEVQYHEVTPDGSLRHPRFKAWRDDKDKDLAA